MPRDETDEIELIGNYIYDLPDPVNIKYPCPNTPYSYCSSM